VSTGCCTGGRWRLVTSSSFGRTSSGTRSPAAFRPYPAGHDSLFANVADGGLVISEWPPGSRPTRYRFLVRNRLIAALTAGTVVVEAGERSGALNTPRHAAELARPLMAVPGPVTSAQSQGCHLIIRDWGGTLVTGAGDVISAIGSGPDHGLRCTRNRLAVCLA
jgi:DNA processing protein